MRLRVDLSDESSHDRGLRANEDLLAKDEKDDGELHAHYSGRGRMMVPELKGCRRIERVGLESAAGEQH